MASLISNELKNFLLKKKLKKDSNLLIYSTEIVPFYEIVKILNKIKDSSEKYIIEDILSKRFFIRQLSLLQNLKFYSNLNQTSISSFLQFFYLEKDYQELKYKFFKECNQKQWSRFEVLFYIYTNQNLLIERDDLYSSLEANEKEFDILLKDKQIFLLTQRKNLNNLIQFFDVFIYINHNEYEIYENSKDFHMKLKNKAKI